MESLKLGELFQKLRPRILDLISLSGGGPGPFASSPHDLNGAHHSGTLADAQMPTALLRDGSRSLLGNLAVAEGKTIDGVDLSAHASNAAAHHEPVTILDTSSINLSLSGQQISGSVIASSDVRGASSEHVLKGDSSGGLKLQTLTLAGDLIVDTDLLVVDQSVGNIGINCLPDSQFDLDIAGNLRAQGWIVGKHALQLPDALMICHYDGPRPYERDFSGDATGHMGQKATIEGGVSFRPGKFGKAVQVAEGGTNKFVNPSFETGVTGWSLPVGSNTITQSNEEALFGSYSMKATYQDTTTLTFETIVLTATAHTFSAYLFIPEDFDGTGVQIAANQFAGITGVTSCDADMSKKGEWQRLAFTATPNAGDLTGNFVVVITGTPPTAGKYIFIDGVQCEDKAYATPYFDGSMPGCAWTDAAHASTSTRTAGKLSYSIQMTNEYSTCFWFNTTTPLADYPNYARIYTWYKDSNNKTEIILNHVGDQFYLYRYVDGVQNSIFSNDFTFDDNIWVHIAVTFDGTDTKLYINGEFITYETEPHLYTNFPDTLYIGTNELGQQPFRALVDDLAIFDRALTADEIRAIYESNAPVFAETSAWTWRTPDGGSWMDESGINLKGLSFATSSPGSQTLDWVTEDKEYIGGLMGIHTSTTYELQMQAYGGPGSIGKDGIITLKTWMNAAAPYSELYAILNPKFGLYISKSGSALGNLLVDGYLAILDGVSAPSPIVNHAVIYVDSADGDLKIKFSDGTTKTIVTD
ncbi:MAG: hypothetical protein CL609_23835 [Anaerolineaceae bacterium]|nr:hypothetical protein [Anaerolineaceae bacterium]